MPRSPSWASALRTRAGSFSPVASTMSAPAASSASVSVRGAARDPIEGAGVERIEDALRALTLECEHIGEDILISARLREW